MLSMFVLACVCWGDRHGSAVLDELSPAGVRALLERWRQRHTDYETLLATPVAEDAPGPVRVGLVLDDLRCPEDLQGLWPNAGRHGRVVVTTHRRDPGLSRADRVLVEVGVFAPEESRSCPRSASRGRGRGTEDR